MFLDQNSTQLNLNDFTGKLILLNFWATWCAPCKEEMPSLDKLQINEKFNNLEIIPIANIGNDSLEKSQRFYEKLEIKNLKIYFDNPITLAKKLSLRGIPTSVLFGQAEMNLQE